MTQIGRYARHCGWALTWLFVTLGCSDDGMARIAGKVTINDEPIVQGTISFFPADRAGASAEAIITDGAYSVSLPKGKKKVVIHGYEKVGEQYPWGKDNRPADILEEIVPAEFNDDSELNIDVDNHRTDVDFLLSSSTER